VSLTLLRSHFVSVSVLICAEIIQMAAASLRERDILHNDKTEFDDQKCVCRLCPAMSGY
jgi:hypothetical protein